MERCAVRSRDQTLNIDLNRTLLAIRENALLAKWETLLEDKRKFLERRCMPDKRASPSVAAIDSNVGAPGNRPHVAILEPDRESRGSRGDVNATGPETFRHNQSIWGSRSGITGHGFSCHGRWCGSSTTVVSGGA